MTQGERLFPKNVKKVAVASPVPAIMPPRFRFRFVDWNPNVFQTNASFTIVFRANSPR